jgi:hypothetical protein
MAEEKKFQFTFTFLQQLVVDAEGNEALVLLRTKDIVLTDETKRLLNRYCDAYKISNVIHPESETGLDAHAARLASANPNDANQETELHFTCALFERTN